MSQPEQVVPGFKPSVEEPKDQYASPLVRFRGTLKEWKTVQGNVRDGAKGPPPLRIKFDFVDLTPIETTEPYPHPIASISISYSERPATSWAVFTKSLRDLIPMDVLTASDNPLDLLTGKTQEWYFADAQTRRPGPDGSGEESQWKMRDTKCWTLADLEGYSAGGQQDISQLIADFIGAEGKKDTEVYQWLYTTQSIKSAPGYNTAVEAIAERTLLSGLVLAGKLIEGDGGVFKAVSGG